MDYKPDTEDPLTEKLSAGTSDRTVQVFVSNEGDSQGLQEILGDQYEVVTDATLRSADCYLLDTRSLHQYTDDLSRRKAEAHPEFCPVIVMQQHGSNVPEQFANPDSDRPPLIDGVIDTPIDPPALHRRLQSLLIRRSQSLALTREYEEIETWFKGLFDAIPDPAFVLSTDGRVHEANDAFREFAGRDRQAVLDVKLAEIPVYKPVFDRVEAHFEEVGRDETRIENESIKLDSGDERMEYGILASQLTEVQNKQYLIGVLADVTELQKKTFRLEKLASVLNHDLRNPAQVAEMRLSGLWEAHPESRNEIEAVQRAISRINELTEKLVTIARTGQGMETEDVMMDSCTREAWANVKTERAELTTEDVHGVTVVADEALLLELFENLYRNSVEHGGETVWVGTTTDGFYVEDDGSGISPEERDDVLRMGYSNNSQGNGLGLGIVNEVVEEHGWDLTIADGREGGARVEIHCDSLVFS